jgi:hypothetical protein
VVEVSVAAGVAEAVVAAVKMQQQQQVAKAVSSSSTPPVKGPSVEGAAQSVGVEACGVVGVGAGALTAAAVRSITTAKLLHARAGRMLLLVPLLVMQRVMTFRWWCGRALAKQQQQKA